MNQSVLFSSGLEFGNLVVSLSLLRRSWNSISDLYGGVVANQQLSSSFSLSYRVYNRTDFTIIAFVTSPISTQDHLQPDLVSSEALRDNYNFPHFEFLCSKKFRSFSVDRTAFDLFCSQLDQLISLKSQIDDSKLLLVTGHALGGSVASLFTIWLLNTRQKRPICITFGSPLIGDKSLQQAILQNATWNSCFLHVASHQDPVPRLFISHRSYSVSEYTQNNVYHPFGTFLLSSNKGCACFEDPESVLELLVVMGSISDPNQEIQTPQYGLIVENLIRKTICKDSTRPENINGSLPLVATISMQLWALGFTHMQQPQRNTLVGNMEFRESLLQKKTFDPSKKLNEAKIDMAYLEWYKKDSNTRGVGYYDSYKKALFTSDQHAIMFKKRLTIYWKDKIAEAEMKPLTEYTAIRKRWLFAGTNYRLMVEPLDIVDYYKKGHRDYIKKGRPEHYLQIQQWLEEVQSTTGGSDSRKKQNVKSILTLDSCFWAHVEEALLMCKLLRSAESSDLEKETAEEKLIEFEDYVYGLLSNYAVSPEIFFMQSSYMDWWNEYKRIKGDSYNSTLAKFMKNPENQQKYANDAFDFP